MQEVLLKQYYTVQCGREKYLIEEFYQGETSELRN